jgi:glycine hydroxymethyltransferase
MIPFDKEKPMIASGIRIGTPSVTTRGMKESEMAEIANLIADAIEGKNDPSALENVRRRVLALTKQFPLYEDLLEK